MWRFLFSSLFAVKTKIAQWGSCYIHKVRREEERRGEAGVDVGKQTDGEQTGRRPTGRESSIASKAKTSTESNLFAKRRRNEKPLGSRNAKGMHERR